MNTDTANDHAPRFDETAGISHTSGGGNLIGEAAASRARAPIAGPNDLVSGTSAGTSINPNIGNLLPNGGLPAPTR